MNDTLAILEARAAVLAQPIKSEQSKTEALEMLLFQLASEIYAIETAYIREIYPLKDYTNLPCAPAFIFGVMNVRRKIIPIIDLRQIFSLEISTEKIKEQVIILEYEELSFALRTESIMNVQLIPIEQIQPPPLSLTGQRLEFLKGVTASGIVILDGHKLLTNQKLFVDESIEN